MRRRRKMMSSAVTITVWIVASLMMSNVVQSGTSSSSGQSCSFDPETDDLDCQLRTLNNNNVTFTEAVRAKRINVVG